MMARSVASSLTGLSTRLTIRLLSTSTTITTAAVALAKSPLLASRRLPLPMTQAIVSSLSPTARFGGIRCQVNRAGDSAYSPLSGGEKFSDLPPPENDPENAQLGCDYNHWLIIMDKPGGEGATKQQMIDSYVQTLAKIVGSEEEAKKKIYNVSCEWYFGFGCELDEETSNKLEGLPGVLFVLPDSYVDPDNQDYGAESYVNGEIVQRPPERLRRVVPQSRRHQDTRRYDPTGYIRIPRNTQ